MYMGYKKGLSHFRGHRFKGLSRFRAPFTNIDAHYLTVDGWSKTRLIQWFCRACFDITSAAYTAGLLLRQIRKSRIGSIAQGQADFVLTSRCGVA